jgi:glycine cleavage system regulatory protein
MTQTVILTFIAKDRPGLVERLAETVAARGGNWLESRMAHLADRFVGVARVEAPKAELARLEAELQALAAEGFHLIFEESDAETNAGLGPPGRVVQLDIVGPDHPGIVRDITRVLAARGASVEEMETDIRPAPMGGGNLFYAKARVRIPDGADAREVSDALYQIGNTLMVDVAVDGK